MRFLETVGRYLRCQRGFLGLGGDKKSTSTTTIGKEDQAYIRDIRQSGQNLQDLANQSGPWAQGPNQYMTNAMDMYGNLQNQYGGMANQYGGMANQAFGNAMGMGLQGLEGYMSPMMQQYQQQTDPAYQQRLQEAMSMGGTLATAPGQAAGQNVRGELFRSNLVGNQMNARAQELGGIANQYTQMGANMLMGDRARMGSLGGQFAGLQGQGLAGQMDTNRNLMLGGDVFRGIDQQLAMDPFNRAVAGHGMAQNAYMGPMSQRTTNVEKGSVLGDLMGIGGMVAGTLMGGPGGGAAAGSALSSLGGGAAPATFGGWMGGGQMPTLGNYGGGMPWGQFGNQRTG